jgi:hypothetical protein
MSRVVDIPFGAYAPDLGGTPNPKMPGYLVDAVAVRSTPNGYCAMPQFVDVTSATVIGGATLTSAQCAAFTMPTTENFFVVTSAGAIFESRAEGTDTWEDVSPATGALDTLGDFFRFDNDVIYVCGSRLAILKNMGSSHATDFATLGGSPPTASTGARVRQHAVFGGGTGTYYSVRTSAIGDPTDWPTPGSADARSKQAIEQDLNPEFGHVQQIVGSEKIGIIFQDQALTRMTYVGGAVVYEFDTFERVSGYGHSGFFSKPVTDGKLWYWYNETGVFATDGYAVKKISEGKIDEALFLNTISHPFGGSINAAYSSAFDARRNLVLFGGNNYTGATTYQLAYNVPDGSFSLLNENLRMAFFGGYRTSSTRELNGRMVYNINGGNRKLQRLSTIGTPNIALQTGFVEIDPGHRVQIQAVHLLGSNLPSTLTLSYKAAETYDDVDVLQTGFTAFTAPLRGIKATARASAPLFSFRVAGASSENQLIRGIRVFYERVEPQ